MSYLCAASSRPSLPSALRSIFYAEFSAGQRLPRSFYHPASFPLNRSCPRSFSSSPRISSLQSEETQPSEEPPSSSNEPFETEKLSQSKASKKHSDPRHDETKSPQKKPGGRKFQSQPRKKPSSSSNKPSEAKKHSQSKASKEHSGAKSDETKTDEKRPEGWQIQKDALKNKFNEGWNPLRKVSPDAVEGMRQLHAAAPKQFTTPVLAEQFKLSPEAVRRILKSKWRPSEEEAEERRERWYKRTRRIWSQMSELGLRQKAKSADRHSDVKVLYGDDRQRPV